MLRIVRRAAIVRPEGGVRKRPPFGVDGRVVGKHHPHVAVRPQEFHLPAQLVGVHQVVGRGPRPKLAAGELETVAQGFRQFLVVLGEDPHLRMPDVLGQHPFHAVASSRR